MKKSGDRATFRHINLEIPASFGQPPHLLPVAPGSRPHFGESHNPIAALEIVYANLRV